MSRELLKRDLNIISYLHLLLCAETSGNYLVTFINDEATIGATLGSVAYPVA
jgi:hypothetical protein